MSREEWKQKIAERMGELDALSFFDWTYFSRALEKITGIEGLKIEGKREEVRESSDLKRGIGSQLLTLTIEVAPLGELLWLISYDDIAKLFAAGYAEDKRALKKASMVLQEGFYRFLLLKALKCVQEMEAFKGLTLQMSEAEVSFERGICLDVEIGLGEESAWGRLVIPEEFQTKWKEQGEKTAYLFSDEAKKIPVYLSIRGGSLEMGQEEWEKVETGDFLLLDRQEYHPKTKSGKAELVFRGLPLFSLEIKGNKLSVGKKVEEAGNLEIGTLEMTLGELLALAPGQKLDLKVDGATLWEGEKKRASGELLYLGEKLGLRILET